jgi:hypothetical protein
MPKDFISKITYKNGSARGGRPVIWNVLIVLSIFIAILLVAVYQIRKEEPKSFDKNLIKHYELLDEVIELGYQAADNGKTEEEFKKELAKYLEGVKFRLETLIRAAREAFRNRSKHTKT